MLVYHYLEVDPDQRTVFDVAHVDIQAQALGPKVVALWEAIENAARSEVEQRERS